MEIQGILQTYYNTSQECLPLWKYIKGFFHQFTLCKMKSRNKPRPRYSFDAILEFLIQRLSWSWFINQDDKNKNLIFSNWCNFSMYTNCLTSLFVMVFHYPFTYFHKFCLKKKKKKKLICLIVKGLILIINGD